MNFDVLIIGAGVSGSAIAYELAKTDLKTAVIEKEEDVCSGTSKANSGICHAGYDALPGSLKARLNVQGNQMMPELAAKLHFDFINNGSLVLCFDENQRSQVEELYKRGLANGVKGLQILEHDEILALEPHVNDNVVCALYAPTGGIVCPFGLNIALAENAADNGVIFIFNEPATAIEKTAEGWLVNQKYQTRFIVNAAGLYADIIHNLVLPEQPLHITPRRGEYFLFDRAAGARTKATLFQLPSQAGKGVLITPTVHGNLLAGPTAEDLEDKEALNTSPAGLAEIKAKAKITMADLPYQQVITSFAGLRATGPTGDFIIAENAPGFIDVAGIESPGLTSAPAIGVMVADMIKAQLHPGENPAYIEERPGFAKAASLQPARWQQLIAEDPDYGQIICRCETITKGEIKDACTRSIPARSLDGIKRRVRAGMGRCQGGFCSPKVMELIAEYQNMPFDQVAKAGAGSQLVCGSLKEADYD